MAAPNNARLIIRILTIAQSTEERRKWLIKFEIIDAESIAGPLFARPNQIAEGFTFESCENLSRGDKVTAEAEYIGDAHRGLYQMKKLVKE